MTDCIFCQIAQKQIPTKLEYEDEDIVAFNDLHPRAPVHILIVPKKHLVSIAQLEEKDATMVGKLIYAAKILAEKKGIVENGFRLCFNTGKHSGQIVDHLHLHLLGGQSLGSMV